MNAKLFGLLIKLFGPFLDQTAMKVAVLRCGFRPLVRCYSIDYLVAAVPASQVPKMGPGRGPKPNKMGPGPGPKSLLSMVITPNQLTDRFRVDEYDRFTDEQCTASQMFFNSSKSKLDWSVASYNDIPDIKFASLQEQKETKYEQMEAYNKTDYHESVYHSRKSFGIKPDLLRPLPEVLLLGHTNAGKSSLINNLLLNREENKSANSVTQHAFVSKRAGYTKTLNSFSIGNKLRIIDSPGYGEFGESAQGKVVIDYITNRSLLRRAFVLIDSVMGFREEDVVIINHLLEVGVPFEVVFTKVDEVIRKQLSKLKVKTDVVASQKQKQIDLIHQANENIINHFDNLIASSGVDELMTVPRILFNNAEISKYTKRRHGYKEIRYVILQSCGLGQTSTPP